MSIKDIFNILDEEYIRKMSQAAGTLKRVLTDLSESISRLSSVDTSPLDNVEAFGPHGSSIFILGYKKKFIATLKIYKVDPDDPVFYVYMAPPLQPHYTLVLAYLLQNYGLKPAFTVRIKPVYSFMGVVVDADVLTTSLATMYSSTTLLPLFVADTASVLPPMPDLAQLPLEPDDDNVYVTEYGVVTRELRDARMLLPIRLGSLRDPPELNKRISLSEGIDRLVLSSVGIPV
jgi:hypothetical protein